MPDNPITFEHRLAYEEVVQPILEANRVRGVTYQKVRRTIWPHWNWLPAEEYVLVTCPAYFVDRLREQLAEAERVEQGEWNW